jgi:dTDP-4-dehydrorhamnose reductase
MTEATRTGAPRPPRRVGVLGAGGQLGRCLVRQVEAAPDLALAFALTREEIDLSDVEGLPAAIAALLDAPPESLPEVVINGAAHTKVDLCESQSELAYRVNALAPGEWAHALSERGIRFIHVSTDYVFSGEDRTPYREDDATDPRTVYGASKRAGELTVLGAAPDALVVRTSWVFGPGRNFPMAILDQAEKRRTGEATGPLRVVDDQVGAPTLAEDLAFALLAIARQDASEWGGGLLHLRNRGETTWYGFAREILDRAGYADVVIEPVSTEAFPTPAKRPAFSVLDCRWAESRGIVMPSWKDALSRYLAGPDCPYELVEPASGVPEPGSSPEDAGGSKDGAAREVSR